jgi:tRNA-dihydrouridine synthase B
MLAPMVGVCDTPFREVCSANGAGLTIGEMLPADRETWSRERNRLKQIRPRIAGPQVVQIAGSDPLTMAEGARLNVERGADAIDINMGCPVKKVLKKAAGSALLRDPALVEEILRAVVAAVPVPVTLKTRTGWSLEQRNGVDIARLAEDCGIALITIHGRTRADRFKGDAEYDTIARIKEAVSIPVIANGDIDSPEKARAVLAHTGADGLMIGRAAQGKPWLFSQIDHYLRTGQQLPAPDLNQQGQIVIDHLQRLHRHYGERRGALFARKHVSGYAGELPGGKLFLAEFNRLESATAQLESVERFYTYPESFLEPRGTVRETGRHSPSPQDTGAIAA